VVVLSLYGVFESVDAVIGVFGSPRGPFAALFDYPLWSLSHFVPGVLFMALAPVQLWASFRNRHRTWHRWSGRIVVASALFLGFSGVAFVFLMPERPLTERVFMLTFFVAFLFFLLKGFLAAWRRDFVHHRAWMIRMFSTGLTITTQRLLLVVFLSFGGVGGVEEFWDQFVTAAWLAWIIQLAVAEWWVARAAARPAAARQAAAI
jgi:hypothetical protein